MKEDEESGDYIVSGHDFSRAGSDVPSRRL